MRQWDPQEGVDIDKSMLPTLMVEFVEAQAALLCCTFDAFLYPFLVVVSAMSNGAIVKLTEQVEYESIVTLFMVLAQPSGGGKVITDNQTYAFRVCRLDITCRCMGTHTYAYGNTPHTHT
jgi:hypothetical protein